MSPTGKSDSVRFVRACGACGRGEAACARETMLLPRLGFGRPKKSATCRPACPSLACMLVSWLVLRLRFALACLPVS